MNYQDVSTQEGAAPQFRYNWSSPLILSPHDSKTLYLGGNRLMRSTNRGASWEIISPDLSTKELMVALHRRLAAGDGMAAALSAARRSVDDDDPAMLVASLAFSCYGAG